MTARHPIRLTSTLGPQYRRQHNDAGNHLGTTIYLFKQAEPLQITDLIAGLSEADQMLGSKEALRDLIEKIVLAPSED